MKINNPPNNSTGIFIFWHNKMLIGWWLFKQKQAAALVSQSKDGEILSKVLNDWNYKVVRGSSSKGGKEALRKIINFVNQNNSAVITPDGPLGPAKEIKNGVLIISNKCNVPLIPIKIIYKNKIVLNKSWDKFEIPVPFSKCEVYFGKPYLYEKYLNEEDLQELKRKVSEEM